MYRIDMPWCNTNCLPQLFIFWPSVTQKEREKCQRELTLALREILYQKLLDHGWFAGEKDGACDAWITYRPTLSWDNWRRFSLT